MAFDLGQQMTNEEAERISALTKEQKELEIRALLEQATDLDSGGKKHLEALLGLFYKHPDRYLRVPDVNSAQAKSKPLPYVDPNRSL